jgi:hypothetical protein
MQQRTGKRIARLPMRNARKLDAGQRAGKPKSAERRIFVTSGDVRAANQLNSCGSRLR